MTPTLLRSVALLTLALVAAAPHVTALAGPQLSEGTTSVAVNAGDAALEEDVHANAGLDVVAPRVTYAREARPVMRLANAEPIEDARRTLVVKSPVRYHDLQAREVRADVPLLPGGEVTVRAARGFGPTLADVTFAALGEDVHANAGHEDRAAAAERRALRSASAAAAGARLTESPATPPLAPLPPEAVPTPALSRAPTGDADAEREAADGGDVRAASSRVADARSAGQAVRVARAVAVAAAAVALPALAAWALYHRVTGAAVLKSPVRRAMMDHLHDAPGAGVNALAAAAGVTYTTAGYHLQRLEAAGHVVSARANGTLRYYVTGTVDARGRAWDELLAHPTARRVLAFIEAHPGTHRAAVARAVTLSTTGVAWYLKRLEGAGLLERRRDGRCTRLFAVADALGSARARVDALRADATA